MARPACPDRGQRRRDLAGKDRWRCRRGRGGPDRCSQRQARRGSISIWCSSSPLQRARKTAAVFGEPIIEPDLMEIDLGRWDGLTDSELIEGHRTDLDAFARGEEVRLGGTGETPEQIIGPDRVDHRPDFRTAATRGEGGGRQPRRRSRCRDTAIVWPRHVGSTPRRLHRQHRDHPAGAQVRQPTVSSRSTTPVISGPARRAVSEALARGRAAMALVQTWADQGQRRAPLARTIRLGSRRVGRHQAAALAEWYGPSRSGRQLPARARPRDGPGAGVRSPR